MWNGSEGRAWWTHHRCERSDCNDVADRFCRVCARWMCKGHRIGSAWWWRCLDCPRAELVEMGRAWRIQRREEREAAPWGRRAKGEDPAQLLLWHHWRDYCAG